MFVSQKLKLLFVLLQVTALSSQLLAATSKLEDLLLDAKDLYGALSKVADKLSTEPGLGFADLKSVRECESWLTDNHLMSLKIGSTSASSPSARLAIKDLEFHMYDQSVGPATTITRSFDNGIQESMSSDFAQGLDDVHDFDWDCEGIQLTVPSTKYLLPATPTATSCELSPLDTAGRLLLDSSQLSEKNCEWASFVSRCPSYIGLYEEAMEMSLELEEEFYSDDDETFDHPKQKLSRPVSLDLGLGLTGLLDGDEFKISPCTQHSYQLVKIDDDMQSVSSDFSSHNSPSHGLEVGLRAT